MECWAVNFTICGWSSCSAVVHNESLPSWLIEKVHDASLFVKEAMGWVLDGNEDGWVLCDDVVYDVDHVV